MAECVAGQFKLSILVLTEIGGISLDSYVWYRIVGLYGLLRRLALLILLSSISYSEEIANVAQVSFIYWLVMFRLHLHGWWWWDLMLLLPVMLLLRLMLPVMLLLPVVLPVVLHHACDTAAVAAARDAANVCAWLWCWVVWDASIISICCRCCC